MEYSVDYGGQANLTGELTKGIVVKQNFIALEKKLQSIKVRFATYRRQNNSSITVEVWDNKAMVTRTTLSSTTINDNAFKLFPCSCSLEKGKEYQLRLYSQNACTFNAVTAKWGEKKNPFCTFNVGGRETPGELNCIFTYEVVREIPNLLNIVVLAYRLEDDVVKSFFTRNNDVFESSGVHVLIVTDRHINDIDKWYKNVCEMVYPIDLQHMNISKLCNYAIRSIVDSETIVVKTDIDIVFSLEVLEHIKKTVFPGFAVNCVCAKIEEKDLNSVVWCTELEKLTVGQGACFAMTRRDWGNICGYDERMYGWGGEDNDLKYRVERRFTLRESSDFPLYHVNHPMRVTDIEDDFFQHRTDENKELAQESPWESKNWGNAGNIYGSENIGVDKIVTFCLCLKNRSAFALESIKSLVTEENAKFFDFIISEDESENMLDLSSFPLRPLITHYVIRTGDKWNRSKVCNYGFRRAKTRLVSSWDADFIFPENFAERFLRDVVSTDFTKQYLRIPVTETHDSYRDVTFCPKGFLYGGMFVYGTQEITSINGYDETFQLYGWEELDANRRLVLKGLTEKEICSKGYVFHKSHGDDMRGSLENYHVNNAKADQHLESRQIYVNETGWGMSELVKRYNYDRTLIVVGNGPSAKHFDFNLMKHFDCIGMNASYRFFLQQDLYPKYFTCFDYVVTDNHWEAFSQFINNSKVTTERFFLLRKVTDNPKLTVINLKRNNFQFSKSLDDFYDGGNTGVNSCQVGICLGYKRIILIGIDCNYVQFVDGAKSMGNSVIEMSKTPDVNPNYFLPDYQQKGDRFNVPNAEIFHRPAWEKLAVYAKTIQVDIVNCGPESTLTCFRKSTLADEGIVLQ